MKVIIIGGRGQLGQTLQAAFSGNANVISWNRPQYDISEPLITNQVVEEQPDLVINAAAWTNVDEAERNPNAAYAINTLGPQYVAEGCRRCGAAIVQISTNEVFEGESGQFYREYDTPTPGSIYARSKLAGERAVRDVLAECYIVRVAWLFGPSQNNFPSKISAAAQKHNKLRVVNDEFGNPTYAVDVAQAIVSLVQTGRYGIYHMVNGGYASRFEFAQFTLQNANIEGVTMASIELEPIPSSEWPRLTTPPPHAVLINQAAARLGIELRPWQDALINYLESQRIDNHARKEQVFAG